MRCTQYQLQGIAFLLSLPISTALPQAPAGAQIQEQTGQVAIHGGPDANTTTTAAPLLPITATVFAGVPGPKRCRGGSMAVLDLPAVAVPGNQTPETCYNLASQAGCGVFIANQADGCEARLFADLSCKEYVNTAVFMPEGRPVGGQWRSMAILCGKPPPDPATLGTPPLQDMVQKAKKTPKGARGVVEEIREELV